MGWAVAVVCCSLVMIDKCRTYTSDMKNIVWDIGNIVVKGDILIDIFHHNWGYFLFLSNTRTCHAQRITQSLNNA